MSPAGIKATVDAGGVSVAVADADRARRVLITDPALAGSDVNVLLVVPAGTGKVCDGGILVPLTTTAATKP